MGAKALRASLESRAAIRAFGNSGVMTESPTSVLACGSRTSTAATAWCASTRCFVDFARGAQAELHDRLMAARAAPEQMAGKAEFDLIVELAPQLEDFIAELFGIEREVRRCRRATTSWRRSIAVKRLFVQRQAAEGVQAASRPPRFDGDGAARGSSSALLGGAVRPSWPSPTHVDALAGRTRPPTPTRSTSPRATPPGRRITPAGQRQHMARRAVPGAAQARSAAPGAGRDRRARRRHHAAAARRTICAARDGFALTDPGTDLDRRARPGELLHLVPQPGQGLAARTGLQGEGPASVQEERRSA